MFISATKQSLRRQLRAFRRSLSPAQQRRAAHELAKLCLRLPAFHTAKTVALYIANDGEINPSSLLHRLFALGKQIYLPQLNPAGTAMVFACYRPGDKLQRNCFGLLQPLPKAMRLAVQAMDIVVLPLVGFDIQGNRLGMGGGFYDRVLDRRFAPRPTLVGLAHQGQQVNALPVEPWDIPLHWVVTNETLIRCPRVRRLVG